ncbi:unnamed protein product [Paramecium octaurelia]|uniref:Transmembrane protein n=1 Tax=Paramecium octaurelia TaxID=43137 RepID=A0A8S1WDY4_PAROT|nr:unnamed protein product [Paramecium octaurelia]
MQMLYESQAQNQYIEYALRGEIQTDHIGYDEKKENKQITWKILKALILIIIQNLNLILIENWNLQQLILFFAILWRQVLQFKELMAHSLKAKCELREILIWFVLITLSI